MPTTAQDLLIRLLMILAIPSTYRKMQDRRSWKWWWDVFLFLIPSCCQAVIH